MPRKPRKPCAYPGCPNLTDDTYCEKHKSKASQQYEKYGRKYSRSERYGNAWRKIRNKYIKEHPYCEECFKAGTMTPAEHVHHIKPLSEGGSNEKDNLMSLCAACHNRLHAGMIKIY